MRKMIWIVMTLLLFSGMSSGCQGGGNDVVIFSSMESYRNMELARQLNQVFPDLNVAVQQISTGNNAAKIQAEGEHTEADIVLGLETTAFQKLLPYFAPLDDFQKNAYLPGFEPTDNRSVPFEKNEGGILVNTVELSKRGLPEPESYQDLLDPRYRGLIVMPSPKTSGTGYMFLNAWVNEMGEDGAFAFVDELQKNIKQFTESGSGPVQMLNQGEAVIGLGMLYQAAEQINEGAPLKIIIPEEGCPYTTTQLGMIKGREKNEAVRRVFAYLNSEWFLYDKEHFVPGKLVEGQQTKLLNYPADLPYLDESDLTDANRKDRLLERWHYGWLRKGKGVLVRYGKTRGKPFDKDLWRKNNFG